MTDPPNPSAAARQRKFRERKRAGKRILAIEVENEFVDRLVSWGWIQADQDKDPTILGDVIADLLECRERSVFHGGPIVVTSTSTGS